MSNSTSFSRLGYLALKKETTAGVAVQPDTYLELIDENVQTKYTIQAVEPIAGKRDARLRSVKDKIEIGGTINVCVDAKTIGYLLQAGLGNPTTTTVESGVVYQHVFTPSNTLTTFTMDVKLAGFNYVYRYVGVRVAKVTFSQTDNKIMAAIEVVPQKSFTTTRLTVAASSGTTMNLKQTTGLTTSDTIIVLDKDDHETEIAEYTISSITSETEMEVSTISDTLDIDDIVVIKKGTPTYDLGENLIWIGGSNYTVGATYPNPVDNAVTVNAEDYTFEFENVLDPRFAATGCNFANRFASTINLKDFRARGSFTNYFANVSQFDDLVNNQEIGTRVHHCGATLSTASAQAATLDFGPGGANGVVTVTADTAGRAGEDYNVTIVINDTDDLAASFNPTGSKNILIELASTTTNKNTATLVAAAVDALSGVSAAASGTGATEFAIAAVAKANLGDTVHGIDANAKESLRVSFPKTKYDVFGTNLTAEDVINQDIKFEAEYDEDDAETVRVVLRNGVTSY